MGDWPRGKIKFRYFFAQHNFGGNSRHIDIAHLRHNGDRPGGSWICFQNIDGIICDGVLDIHEAYHIHGDSYFLGIFIDRLNMFLWDADRWDDTGGVP